MSENLEKAVAEYNLGGYTCVLFKKSFNQSQNKICEEIYTSSENGLKPLLEFINKMREQKIDLNGFSAADKIVGRAAAFLYKILGIKEIYAEVMSESASKLLDEFGITHSAKTIVKKIINRQKTGQCPMETAVENSKNPEEAEIAIRKKIAEMNKK